MAQIFWIQYLHTTLPIPAGKCGEECISIVIPDTCPFPTCGKPIKISSVGSAAKYDASTLRDTCAHTIYYPKIWEMRLENPTQVAAVDNQPQQCQGCGTINEYAVPNTPQGKYTCYNCRSF